MTPDGEKISIIEWIRPDKRPDDASYILIKMREPESEEAICIPGSYENGCFLDVLAPSGVYINKKCILGWSYYPYDDRAQRL